MKKNRWIPFKWLPASWGLAGPLYDEAEAYYLYDGYELETRLAELKFDGIERQMAIIDIDFKYSVIDEYTRDIQMAALKSTETEKKIAKITADIEFGLIPEKEGQKEIATLRDEPWISVIADGIDPLAGPNSYFFEFDWNDKWIEMLKEAGYEGSTEEHIVNNWFSDLCRSDLSDSMGPTIGLGGPVVS